MVDFAVYLQSVYYNFFRCSYFELGFYLIPLGICELSTCAT